MPLPTPAETFARIERAHAAWTRGGATVVVSSANMAGTRRAEFRLDLDGAGGATLRIKSPARARLAATDQGYRLRGAALIGVDYVANEATRRPAPDRGPIGLRLAAVLGELDDAVGFLSSPATRERYLAPFRPLTGWRVVPSGLVRTTTGAGRASLTRLDLDGSGKLTALHIALPGSTLDWRIAYGPVRPLPMPKRLRLVNAFTARPRPPVYADGRARRVVETMLRRSAGLETAIVRLDGASTLWISGSRVRYESGETGFAFDGTSLIVATPGAAYRGRSSRRAVIDRVAMLLGNVDPFVRGVLVRATPFGDLFPPEARVRVVGSMSFEGVACDVLKVESPAFQASVFARKSDSLPVSVETSALDRRGNAVSTTRRSFDWRSVGGSLPDAMFALRLRPGVRVLDLPPVARPTAP